MTLNLKKKTIEEHAIEHHAKDAKIEQIEQTTHPKSNDRVLGQLCGKSLFVLIRKNKTSSVTSENHMQKSANVNELLKLLLNITLHHK